MTELYAYLRGRMREHPNRTVRDESRSMTFAGLFEEAERLGASLTGRLYGVLCRSDLDTARWILACLSAGKTAVPLSRRYGAAHADAIRQAAGLSCILTEEGPLSVGEPLPDEQELEDIRLILYTSGTTGVPKGAMLSDAGLLTNLQAIEGYFRINGRIRIARPLYHCAVLVGEFLLALSRGVDIVFDNGDFQPLRLLETVRRDEVSVLCGTPTLFYQLCKAAVRRGRTLPLQAAAVSGECMTPSVAAQMREAMPETAIYHVYGLTEAGPRVSFLPPEFFDAKPNAVGRPLSCFTYRIENGELLLRGGSLMKGYYRHPKKTAHALAGGWLHTGDAAEMDADGDLVIRSRLDDLIIRAGVNIYPQEIENRLRQEEAVEDVIACGVPDPVAGQRICIRAVAPRLTREEFWKLCQKRLSPYQFPDEFELTESLPRNASGKVLRNRSE